MSSLRSLQYHFPSERPDDDDPIRRELRDLGAELVEAKGQEKDKGKAKSYHLKALAVVQCPWREVLYLVSGQLGNARDPLMEISLPFASLPVDSLISSIPVNALTHPALLPFTTPITVSLPQLLLSLFPGCRFPPCGSLAPLAGLGLHPDP